MHVSQLQWQSRAQHLRFASPAWLCDCFIIVLFYSDFDKVWFSLFAVTIIYGSSCPKEELVSVKPARPSRRDREKERNINCSKWWCTACLCIELAVARRSRHSNRLIIWLNTWRQQLSEGLVLWVLIYWKLQQGQALKGPWHIAEELY